MSWFAKPKTKKEQMEEQRRRRRGDTVVLSVHWLNFRHVLGAVLFVLVATAITLICFAGVSPVTQQLVASQREQVRVVSAFPFSYISNLQTQRAQKLAELMVGPSFKQPDHSVEDRMKQAVLELQTSLDQYQKDATSQTPVTQSTAREKIAREFNAKNGFDLDPNDVAGLTEKTDAKQRMQAFDEALASVHGILNHGVFDAGNPGFQATTVQGVVSQEDALNAFHKGLAPLELDAPAKAAVYNLLKQTLVPNIEFDKVKTQRAQTAALDAVKPIVEQVHEGQVLVDPNVPAYDIDDQNERLNAYYTQLRQHTEVDQNPPHLLAQRFLYTTLLLLAALIFVKSGLGQFMPTPKNIALVVVLLLLNLTFLRGVIGLGSTSMFAPRSEYLALLPWFAPTTLAPLLVTVMLGVAPGVLVALMINMLFAMMTGDTLEVFLMSFLVSLVAVYFCRDVRMRAKLVRAGLLGGLAAALCAAYLGLINPTTLTTADIGRQMFAATLTGLLTAVAAIGLLPLCENLFKITTDITLLELTDFNHPLLRKLQIAAPGSYHHSLMVANLSERAAAEVGANPLLCRACSLYHDIGKISKPEYFTENQRDGYNPHEEVSPSMSALIIKSHVTEGLDLARQYKLPRIVQDVIVQHHGTTLIKYFYHKATRQQRLLTQTPFAKQRAAVERAAASEKKNPDGPAEPVREDTSLDQSFYRYEGPKPNFKESAIIALADCVEAASRSLRKVTPQAVEELVESLVNDRIEDHQLDDSPITILELKKIKQSFTFTLLNMLHSRVHYPEHEGPAKPSSENTPLATAAAPTTTSPSSTPASAANATPKSAA